MRKSAAGDSIDTAAIVDTREPSPAGNILDWTPPQSAMERPMTHATPENTGKKAKGPRKARTPARTVVYLERLFSRFTLAQRKAMYEMLSSVCEPTLTDDKPTEPNQ